MDKLLSKEYSDVHIHIRHHSLKGNSVLHFKMKRKIKWSMPMTLSMKSHLKITNGAEPF